MSDQPPIDRKQPRVKPPRFLLLLFVAFGCITLISLIGLVCMAEWPSVSAIAWHIRHGKTVTLEGHTFKVPLLYGPEISKGGAQIDMIEYPGLFNGIGTVTLESTGKILDETSTDHWRSTLMDLFNRHPNGSNHYAFETIRGTRLIFLCIVDTSDSGQSLVCRAAGTDLTAHTNASSDHIKDTRAVLETSN